MQILFWSGIGLWYCFYTPHHPHMSELALTLEKKKKKKSCKMNGLVETVCEMLSGSVSSCRQSLPCSLNVVTFSPLRGLLREPGVTDAVDWAKAAERARNKCMKNMFHQGAEWKTARNWCNNEKLRSYRWEYEECSYGQRWGGAISPSSTAALYFPSLFRPRSRSMTGAWSHSSSTVVFGSLRPQWELRLPRCPFTGLHLICEFMRQSKEGRDREITHLRPPAVTEILACSSSLMEHVAICYICK